MAGRPPSSSGTGQGQWHEQCFRSCDDALARLLAEARSRLAGAQLPAAVSARLHRHFIAICAAVKATSADQDSCERRISSFLAIVEQAVDEFRTSEEKM